MPTKQEIEIEQEKRRRANIAPQTMVNEAPSMAGFAQNPGYTGASGYVAETLGNVPSSTQKLFTDIFDSISNPSRTLQGGRELINGIANKTGIVDGYDETVANNMGGMLVDRYGGADNILNTIKTDPAGFLSDIAGVGSLLPKASKIGSIARAVDPVNAMANSTAAGVRSMANKSNVPARALESAAKFSTTMTPNEANSLISTMLKEGIKPTNKGAALLRKKLDVMESKVKSLVDKADDSGAKISVDEITKNFDELRAEMGSVRHMNSAENIDIINKVESDFMMGKEGKAMLPSDAQALKRDIYDTSKYNKKNLIGIGKTTQDARKSLGRGAKESVERVTPGVKELNELYGPLLELKKPLLRAARRIENRDFVGLGTPMKVIAGASAGEGAGAIAGLLAGILDMPKPKSSMAMLLRQKPAAAQFLNNNRMPILSRELARLMSGVEPVEGQ